MQYRSYSNATVRPLLRHCHSVSSRPQCGIEATVLPDRDTVAIKGQWQEGDTLLRGRDDDAMMGHCGRSGTVLQVGDREGARAEMKEVEGGGPMPCFVPLES